MNLFFIIGKDIFNDYYDLDENFYKKIFEIDFFKNSSKIKEYDFTLEIDCLLGHAKIWDQCRKKEISALVLPDNAVVDENFNMNVFRELIEKFDFVYVEDYSIYVISHKVCKFLIDEIEKKYEIDEIDFCYELHKQFLLNIKVEDFLNEEFINSMENKFKLEKLIFK